MSSVYVVRFWLSSHLLITARGRGRPAYKSHKQEVSTSTLEHDELEPESTLFQAFNVAKHNLPLRVLEGEQALKHV